MSDRAFNNRQRQQKNQLLERIEARIKPKTLAWLKHIGGDSSFGIAIDTLCDRFSTLSGDSPGTK